MDRGFASLDFLQQNSTNNKYFVVRIPNNYKLEFDEDSEFTKVGTGKRQRQYRVVNFCALENQTEYGLATNLPKSGEGELNNE